jgi:small subunit ribosomal protein S2
MFPTFLPYAYGTRAGVTIIDLEQSLPMLRRAANVVRAIAQNNGLILFVGTSPSLRPIVAKAAERLGPNGFHIGERWLPGTLTNRMGLFGTEVARNQKLKPDCVIFLNPLNNLHAIRECAIEHIPTVGITDSNVDPRIVMYSIPANDESVRTAELVAGVLSLAGKQVRQLVITKTRSNGIAGTGMESTVETAVGKSFGFGCRGRWRKDPERGRWSSGETQILSRVIPLLICSFIFLYIPINDPIPQH